MSASDGFTYVGERFTENFPDFIEKYRFFDMLQASLHPYGSWQEYWHLRVVYYIKLFRSTCRSVLSRIKILSGR